jgi:hypothetical protein
MVEVIRLALSIATVDRLGAIVVKQKAESYGLNVNKM